MKRNQYNVPFYIQLSLVVFILIVLLAILAPVIAPYSLENRFSSEDMVTRLTSRLLPPFFLEGGSRQYLLGTDDTGMDVLSMLLYGTRMSLLIAMIGTIIGAVVGTLIGFLAAHFKGLIDHVVVMMIDFQASIPFLILALAFTAFLGSGFDTLLLIMSIYGWERYARLSRALSLSMQEENFIKSIGWIGIKPIRIYLKHIFPNIMGVILVNITLNFPMTILMETSLSFLGVGISFPQVSLGTVLGHGRNFLINAWWVALLPACIVFLITMTFSVIAEWLKEQIEIR